MTHEVSATTTRLVAFWQALDKALDERGLPPAMFGEVRAYYESGYRAATVARVVALIAGDATQTLN
jgi:hypothetical protein